MTLCAVLVASSSAGSLGLETRAHWIETGADTVTAADAGTVRAAEDSVDVAVGDAAPAELR